MSSEDLGADPKFTRVVAAANELRLALEASTPPGRRLAVCHTKKLEECFLWYMSEMLAAELQLGARAEGLTVSADSDADALGLGPSQRAAFFLGQAMSLLHSVSENFRRAAMPAAAAEARELAVKCESLARRAFPPDPPTPKLR